MAAGAEPEVLREYRHLLRTASADWQETAHRHALQAIGAGPRERVLAECQRLLQTGTRLTPHDIHAVARLIVLAERRRPRTILGGLPPDLLQQLAAAVVQSPVGRMLRAGIDVWDGAEPPTPSDPTPDPDHHQRWHEQRATPGDAGEYAVFWFARPPRAGRR